MTLRTARISAAGLTALAFASALAACGQKDLKRNRAGVSPEPVTQGKAPLDDSKEAKKPPVSPELLPEVSPEVKDAEPGTTGATTPPPVVEAPKGLDSVPAKATYALKSSQGYGTLVQGDDALRFQRNEGKMTFQYQPAGQACQHVGTAKIAVQGGRIVLSELAYLPSADENCRARLIAQQSMRAIVSHPYLDAKANEAGKGLTLEADDAEAFPMTLTFAKE